MVLVHRSVVRCVICDLLRYSQVRDYGQGSKWKKEVPVCIERCGVCVERRRHENRGAEGAEVDKVWGGGLLLPTGERSGSVTPVLTRPKNVTALPCNIHYVFI